MQNHFGIPISDCQNFVWACLGFSKKYHDLLGAISGFHPSFLPLSWKAKGVDRQCSPKCQKHQLEKMQIREIKFSRFVSRKLIQVGKKWSNKQFEILNRSFIQQIVWNFTNPLVLTFLGFLLIYRFQTRGTGSGPKIQIRKHSWRKRKSELGEKCSKQTGSGSFVVACPQLRSLCPLGAIAYVWLRAEKTFLQTLLQELKATLMDSYTIMIWWGRRWQYLAMSSIQWATQWWPWWQWWQECALCTEPGML